MDSVRNEQASQRKGVPFENELPVVEGLDATKGMTGKEGLPSALELPSAPGRSRRSAWIVAALLLLIGGVSGAAYLTTRSAPVTLDFPPPPTIDEVNEMNAQYEQKHVDSMVGLRGYAYVPTPIRYFNARGHQFQWSIQVNSWGMSDEQAKELLKEITPTIEKWQGDLSQHIQVDEVQIDDPQLENLPDVIRIDIGNAKQSDIRRIRYAQTEEMKSQLALIDHTIDERLNEKQRAVKHAEQTDNALRPEEIEWYLVRYDGRTMLLQAYQGEIVGYPSFNVPWPWHSIEQTRPVSL